MVIVGIARAAGMDAGVVPGVVPGVAPGAAGAGSETLGAGQQPLGDASPDWWTILAELDARRVRALSDVDPALLSTYAHEGSTAWREDAALLADLSGRGLRPEDLASRVLAVERVDHEGTHAQLQVVDDRSGYSMITAGGAAVSEVEPAGPRRWAVTLIRLAPSAPDPLRGWRVVSVVPVPAGESSGADARGGASPAGEEPADGGAP